MHVVTKRSQSKEIQIIHTKRQENFSRRLRTGKKSFCNSINARYCESRELQNCSKIYHWMWQSLNRAPLGRADVILDSETDPVSFVLELGLVCASWTNDIVVWKKLSSVYVRVILREFSCGHVEFSWVHTYPSQKYWEVKILLGSARTPREPVNKILASPPLLSAKNSNRFNYSS